MKDLKPIIFDTMKGYDKKQLVSDVVAGIIVAIIALPLSIALALASGVGPEQGIYTAIIAGFVIALFGGSHVQISGPTAAFATIVAGIVAENGMEGLVQLYERCKRRGVKLVLSHVNEHPRATMEKAGFVELVGEENFCENIDAAIARAKELI